jgi:hypothetical protein
LTHISDPWQLVKKGENAGINETEFWDWALDFPL